MIRRLLGRNAPPPKIPAEIAREAAQRFPVPENPPGLERRRQGMLTLRKKTAALGVSVIALVAGAGGYYAGVDNQPESEFFEKARLVSLEAQQNQWAARDTCTAEFKADFLERTGERPGIFDAHNSGEIAACHKAQELQVARYNIDAGERR